MQLLRAGRLGLGKGIVQLFRWFPAGPVPAAYDLRQLGWQLLGEPGSATNDPAHALLAEPASLTFPDWLRLAGVGNAQRKWVMLLGVSDTAERARMLRMGFGDVLGFGAGLEELAFRVQRLAHFAQSLPRFRVHGPLRIDLLSREAFVAGRALGLHPREFALLWRLADTPGHAVTARELLCDVWRLVFRPETNSLAVHISRLRAKLRLAGVDGLIETRPDGSYRMLPLRAPVHTQLHHFALDGHSPIGEERGYAAAPA